MTAAPVGLVEFLRARLDEDEAIAEKAADFPYLAPADAPWVRSATRVARGTDLSSDAHIARWDPARVIAEVEAKRRIVDRYDANLDRQTDPEESQLEADIIVAEYEHWTLIALAQPYADHADFDAAWRMA